jgi:hypothetical protein
MSLIWCVPLGDKRSLCRPGYSQVGLPESWHRLQVSAHLKGSIRGKFGELLTMDGKVYRYSLLSAGFPEFDRTDSGEKRPKNSDNQAGNCGLVGSTTVAVRRSFLRCTCCEVREGDQDDDSTEHHFVRRLNIFEMKVRVRMQKGERASGI